MSQVKDDTGNPFEGWVPVHEAAALIDRGTSTVWGWAMRGVIRSYQIGRRIHVVNIQEVREFEKNRARKPR